MNTPRLCISETKKAFRQLMKREDLLSAIQALCNLKGVGPAMASSKSLQICLCNYLLMGTCPKGVAAAQASPTFPFSAPQHIHILSSANSLIFIHYFIHSNSSYFILVSP